MYYIEAGVLERLLATCPDETLRQWTIKVYNEGVESVTRIRCMRHRAVPALPPFDMTPDEPECAVCVESELPLNNAIIDMKRVARLSVNWRNRHECIVSDPESDEESIAWARGLRQAAIEIEQRTPTNALDQDQCGARPLEPPPD